MLKTLICKIRGHKWAKPWPNQIRIGASVVTIETDFGIQTKRWG